jgi:hypothetical protein
MEKARWYKITGYRDDNKIAEHNGEDVHLRQRFYDEDGEQLLTAVRIVSEGLPPKAIQSVMEMLTLAELSPTMILGPHTDLVRLKPLGDVQSRRMEAEYEKARSGGKEEGVEGLS